MRYYGVRGDKGLRVWFWRLAHGPAKLIDAAIYTVTLSFLRLELAIFTGSMLARARIDKLVK